MIRRMLRQHLQRRHRQKHQRKLRLQVVIRPETFPVQAVPQQSRPHQGIHLAVERTMEHRQSPMVLRQIRRKKRSRQVMQVQISRPVIQMQISRQAAQMQAIRPLQGWVHRARLLRLRQILRHKVRRIKMYRQ